MSRGSWRNSRLSVASWAKMFTCVKPVKKLVVIRSDTRDSEWRKEFVPSVTDFAETLPARIPAFEGMAGDPMFGRVLLVSYADGTEDRVACPYEGIFIKR